MPEKVFKVVIERNGRMQLEGPTNWLGGKIIRGQGLKRGGGILPAGGRTTYQNEKSTWARPPVKIGF